MDSQSRAQRYHIYMRNIVLGLLVINADQQLVNDVFSQFACRISQMQSFKKAKWISPHAKESVNFWTTLPHCLGQQSRLALTPRYKQHICHDYAITGPEAKKPNRPARPSKSSRNCTFVWANWCNFILIASAAVTVKVMSDILWID